MATNVTYTVGRLCAVITRPLCVFAANNYLTGHAAQGVAVTFLASALALVVSAAGPHRKFYAQYFSADAKVNGLTFYRYVVSTVLMALFGSLVVIGITWHFMQSVLLALAAVGYFFSEKLVDEILRLRLFERDFQGWGRANVARTILQLSGLIVAFGIGRNRVPAIVVVLILTVTNILVFFPQLPAQLKDSVRLRLSARFIWLTQRAARSLVNDWLLWVIAVLSAAVSYLDRILALTLDKESLPLFTLVVMCFGIVQMAMNFYFVSHYRRDFLEQRISIRSAIATRRFAASFFGGLLLSLLVVIAALSFSKHGAEFPIVYIVVIAVLQSSLALVEMPREILFWSHLLNSILHVECLFWGMLVCVVVAKVLLNLSSLVVFNWVMFCAVWRLALYMKSAVKLPQTSHVSSLA